MKNSVYFANSMKSIVVLIVFTISVQTLASGQQLIVEGNAIGGTLIHARNDDITTSHSSAIFGEGLAGVTGLALAGHHLSTNVACGVCGISNYNYSHGVYGELNVNSVSSAVRGRAFSRDGYAIHGSNMEGVGARFTGKKYGLTVYSSDTTGAYFSSASGIAAHFNGRIGIKTDFPEKELDVRGESIFKEVNKIATFQSSGPNAFIELQSNGNGVATNLGNDANNKFFYINVPSSTFGDLIVGHNGLVSIGGDQTPDAHLDVVGSIHYTGSITDVSDIRLKENVQEIKNPLQSIMTLHGFTYNLIGDTMRSAGVSAQEVRNVLPEAVSQIDEKYLGVDYSQLVPLLIEAVKEQQGMINMLEQEIQQLKKITAGQTGYQSGNVKKD